MAGDGLKRVYSRISETDYEKMMLWADKRGQSASEFVEDAILERMARLSGDFDAPTLTVQRLGQLTEAVQMLITSNESIRDEMSQGFASLLGVMTFGDYVSEEIDAEV